jgi:hypothetical protein
MQRMPWFTKQHVVATLLALALLLAAAPVAAQPAPTTAPDIATIDRYIADEMRAQHIPGLALGIVQGDQIVYLKGFGVADPSRRAITPQTPFPISKLSKTFTALAVMQLVEAGKIELDAPVQRYIPWFRVSTAAAPAGITVCHLPPRPVACRMRPGWNPMPLRTCATTRWSSMCAISAPHSSRIPSALHTRTPARTPGCWGC